jgi:hypothetical protein
LRNVLWGLLRRSDCVVKQFHEDRIRLDDRGDSRFGLLPMG